MTTNQKAAPTAKLSVDNIGGIDHTEIDLEPGLTVLTGENATNRTSLLLSLNEVLGGSMGTIRRGADAGGRVELNIDDETYVRTLSSEGRAGISRGGNPYCDDEELVNLFATLIERNKIRNLIETQNRSTINSRLAELLMEPVDIEAIQAQIEELQRERDDLQRQLEEIEQAKEKLPKKQEKYNAKQEELEEVQEELEEKREEMREVETERDEEESVEDLLDEQKEKQDEYQRLKSRRSSLEDEIEEREATIEQLEDELSQLETNLEDMEAPEESRIEELEDQKKQLNQMAEFLSSLVESNERLLTGDLPSELLASEDVSEQLAPAEDHEIDCPTCGSTVEKGSIQERITRIRDMAAEYEDDAEEVQERIDDLRSQRKKKNRLEQEKENRENEIESEKNRIEVAENKIDETEEKIEDVEDDLEDLNDRLEDAKEQRNEEYQELASEVGELQSKESRLSNRVDNLEQEIAELESQTGDEDDLKDEIDEIDEELDDLRGRLRSTERRAIEAVETHMENLIDVMDYENLARIRIDHKPPEDPNKLADFEMVIIRENQSGSVREEQDVTTLSESERSLIGVVVALAGYITHKVEEEVPFLLFDSIEQFDSERIDRMMNYVREEIDVDYMVAALLPEDADQIDTEHAEIGSEVLVG